MAFPTTTGFSIITNGATYSRPFISSGGNVYIVGKRGTTALGAEKATDPTTSFSNVGTDVTLSGTLFCVAAVQSGDNLHVVTTDGSSSSMNYRYHVFSMSSDSWTTSNETVELAVNGLLSLPAQANFEVGIRSDGDIVLLYQGNKAASMGSDYRRVDYARRESGSWTVGIAVDDAGAANWHVSGLVAGSSDRMHFFFMEADTPDSYQRTLTSANSLETFPTAYATNYSGTIDNSFKQGVSYVSGANTKVRFPANAATSSDVNSIKFDSADAPTISIDTDISGTDAVSPVFKGSAMVAEGTNLWHCFMEQSSTDLWVQSNADDAGWGSASAEITTGIAYIAANVYDRGGDTVIGFAYVDGANIYYNEKVLVSGGPVGTSNVTLAALTNSGDGDVFVAGTSTTTLATVTNTTDGTISVSGDSSVTLATVSNTTDGDILVQGTSSVTLDTVGQTADGTVADPPITGDSSVTLDDVGHSGAGVVVVSGDSTSTLDDATNSGAGVVFVAGDSSSTLDDATNTTDAAVLVSGDSTVTLDSVSPTTDASIDIQGTSSVTLDTVTQDATGVVGFPVIEGTSEVTLGSVTNTADASVSITGDSNVTLDAITPSATAITFKTRLYLTRDTHTLLGSLPIGPQATAPLLADYNVVTGTNLRSMSVEIHNSTTTLSGASDAETLPQVGFYGMWTSNPLDGNQTITDQHININAAFQQSSLAMNLGAGFTAEVYVWRPSTGLKIGTIQHDVAYADDAEISGAAQLRVDHGTSTSSTEVAALDGDVIVCELYHHHTQDDAVAYSGTIQVGGNVININTNASASNHAGFIEFENAYTFDLDVIVGQQFNVDFDDLTQVATGSVISGIVGNSDVTLDSVTPSATGETFKTRLYLHTPANALSGTFPTDSQATSPLVYDYTMADATTLRTMDTTIGTPDPYTFKSGNSVATTSQQDAFCGFWTSPPLDGDQTITDAGLNINAAFYQSNTGMNFGNGFTSEIYVWRPSTGAKIGTVHHGVSYDGVAEPTSAFSEQVNNGTSSTSTSVAALDGDVIIAELHQLHTQDSATSYQGAFYFDGGDVNVVTGAAVGSHASFVEFGPLYAFQASPAIGTSNVTLDSVGQTADGTVSVSADSSVALDAATNASDVSILIIGTSSVALDDLTQFADGIIGEFITGTSDVTLDALSQTADGSVIDPVVIIQRGGDDAPPRRRKRVPPSDKPNPDKLLEKRMEETLDELINPKPPVEPSADALISKIDPREFAESLLPIYTLPKQRVIRPGRMRKIPPLTDEELIRLLLMVL